MSYNIFLADSVQAHADVYIMHQNKFGFILFSYSAGNQKFPTNQNGEPKTNNEAISFRL